MKLLTSGDIELNPGPEQNLAQNPPTAIYLGHLDELHYVSTAAVTCGSDALENQHSIFEVNRTRCSFYTAAEQQSKKKTDVMLTGKGSRPVKVLNAN